MIEDAFSSVPYPGDANITIHNENCWECAEVAAKYKGRRWQDYKDRPLDLVGPPIRDAFLFFTPQAFRYYAPLAMLAIVETPKEVDMLSDYFFHSLTPISGDHASENAARMGSFSADELRALRLVLRFAAHGPLRLADGPEKTTVSSLIKDINMRLKHRGSL